MFLIGKNPTFLKLQNQLVQTRKHRRGISNRLDYYDDSNEYAFDASRESSSAVLLHDRRSVAEG